MTLPEHIILWFGDPFFRYIICERVVSRGVTIYRRTNAAYEWEADAQRHLNDLASREALKISNAATSTPPVSGTAGVSPK